MCARRASSNLRLSGADAGLNRSAKSCRAWDGAARLRLQLQGLSSALSAKSRHFARNCCSPACRCRWRIWLGHNGVERALLVAPVLLILIVELLNSAIEATVDRIGLERHVLAGLAKDIGSAAVMLSFICWAWSGCWCSLDAEHHPGPGVYPQRVR